MELSNAIKKRRSVRNYKDDKIDKKIINDILYHGTLAPSGHNRQPWHFLIIEDNVLKNKISELVFSKDHEFNERTANVIKQVPSLIIVYDNEDYNNDMETMFDVLSVGACMQNMCLKATEYGIGSLWIGLICQAEQEINTLLNTNKKMLGAFALGYPNEEKDARPRKRVDDVSEWK